MLEAHAVPAEKTVPLAGRKAIQIPHSARTMGAHVTSANTRSVRDMSLPDIAFSKPMPDPRAQSARM